MQSEDLWDDVDGFFYDVFRDADGTSTPIRVRSIVGVLPILATVVLGPDVLRQLRTLHKRSERFLEHVSAEPSTDRRGRLIAGTEGESMMVSVIPPGNGLRILGRVFDEAEFLSPYGLRALSREHAEHPVSFTTGGTTVTVDYEPAESSTGMFGGNSNWRGPVWMPVNYLIVRNLQRYALALGDDVTIEYPTGSGADLPLGACADDLRRRLISLFLPGADGRRPCHGYVERMQSDPRWRDNITFNEYFHGDNGAGLGATHQTGWTGLVADLICRPNPVMVSPDRWRQV
jgi:hypothetical protein